MYWSFLQVKHQNVIKRKIIDIMIKNMDKYAILNKFHYDRRLKVYMYELMYVDSEKIEEEDYFPDTTTF